MHGPSNTDTFSIGGWRQARGDAALSEVNRSVALPGGTWRRFAAFLGPGYMVAVGYMDPGNWATSLAGGSQFGYALLVVALISNIMAIVLQSLCARLAIASGRDLAQACRDAFPGWVNVPLWLLAETAIIATDIAEVIGTAIGLNLLFGIPLEIGVMITALDAGGDRRVLWHPDRPGRSELGRGHPGFCAYHRDRYKPEDALPCTRHSGRDRHAA
jgi:manganese transport protein